MVWHSMALADTIFEWCLNHRMHHRYSDTEADPHNASRGFFFAHMGNFNVRKTKEFKDNIKSIYIDDLITDRVVAFNKKFFWQLTFFIWGFIPIMTPTLLWQESVWVSLTINVLRFA